MSLTTKENYIEDEVVYVSYTFIPPVAIKKVVVNLTLEKTDLCEEKTYLSEKLKNFYY